MSEGTKLGEFSENQDFSAAVKREVDEALTDSSVTKMGEVSDFEKSLLSDESSKKDASKATESDDSEVQNDAAFVVDEIEKTTGDALDTADFFQNELDRLVVDYQDGDIIEGTVRSVEKSGILVDINYKSDGFVSNSEFSHDPNVNIVDEVKPGDTLKVFIVKLESKEGYTVLSKKRADYELAWGTLSRASKTRDHVSVRIVSKVQGGLVAEFEGIKGFIPASQILTDSNEDLETFIGQTLEVSVLQSDRRRRKVIFSHKQAASKSQRHDIQEFLNELEVGQTRDGKVTSIKDFGVFVDIGGVEGLVHISELSWSRVSSPSDLVNVGDDVKVFILGVDRESGKVSLGMKQLEPDPWANVASKYNVGQVVSGVITRVAPFGAFIRLDDHIEGLIHISELSYDHVDKVDDIVKPEQTVSAKIIKLIPEEQKIGLSLKGIEVESETGTAVGDALEAARGDA